MFCIKPAILFKKDFTYNLLDLCPIPVSQQKDIKYTHTFRTFLRNLAIWVCYSIFSTSIRRSFRLQHILTIPNAKTSFLSGLQNFFNKDIRRAIHPPVNILLEFYKNYFWARSFFSVRATHQSQFNSSDCVRGW